MRCAYPTTPPPLRCCGPVTAPGMYVMNEAFDLWTRAKTSLDYSAHFTDRALSDLEAMVRVARSHPCVILYSIGNEIPECATGAGVRLSAELTAAIRAMDATRPITAGINGNLYIWGRDGPDSGRYSCRKRCRPERGQCECFQEPSWISISTRWLFIPL